MDRKNSTDMKRLCDTIAGMQTQPEQKDMRDAFHGTLTEMARQVADELMKEDSEQLDEGRLRPGEAYKILHRNEMARRKVAARTAARKKIEDPNKGGSRASEGGSRPSDELVKEETDLVGSILEAMSRKDKKINRNRTLRKNREAAKRVASDTSPAALASRERAAKEADAVYRRVTGKPPLNEGEYGPDADWKGDAATQAAMKRLAAKALKKARKKAGKSSTDDKYAGSKPKAGKTDPDMKNARMRGAMAEEIELAEKAAPGYEDWASDPKVKASFKKQYGKRWKQVMYGRSWNMKKMDEETDLQEGVSAKRKRIIRKAILSNNDLKPEVADFMKRSFQKQRHRDEILSGGKGAVKALEVRMKRRSDARKAKHGYSSSGYQGLPESEQLDEAGYKRLMRLKKAAYTAQDKAYRSFTADQNKPARLARAAAEREAQVAAGMARRGGASPDAVRGGGSRIGKSGKYTQKAGALANQRDKALAKFRGRASGSKSREAVQGAFGMHNKNATTKRKMQQAHAAFEKKARTGDFDISPSAKMHQMFARLNFQKTYGRLKGK